MTPGELEFVARLCRMRTGRSLDTSVPERTALRLGIVARREGYGSVDDLLLALRTSEAERLTWPVVEGLTAFERGFMEDPGVLQQVARRILPHLAGVKGGEPVRIWCAAAGSGQDPYSLAILAQEAAARMGGDLRVEIYASDLSVKGIERARKGVFSHFEIQKGLSARQMIDHFQPVDGGWQAASNLREMIRWRRVNLVSDSPGSLRFDLVVCRGVLPQMAAHVRPSAVINLALSLSEDGFLVLGRGEGEGEADVTPALLALPGLDAIFARNLDFRTLEV
jgi:chemotaxis protein methyltransferase CheR